MLKYAFKGRLRLHFFVLCNIIDISKSLVSTDITEYNMD